MSGIAGVMMREGEPPGALLRAMLPALAHRGPDGAGNYRSGNVGMVHRRLAIIDLATGDQPLYEPGGAALVANGMIANDRELRRDLPGVGFQSESDCEVPLHLYRRDGVGFTRALHGMYAIALHDPAAGRLVLARDPFGIKPLYYAETARFFAFASEPQALVAAGIVAPQVAPAARNELLQMQFTTGRETIFAGVNRVLPGETVVVRQGRIVERRRAEALPLAGPLALDEEEALARLDRAFADSAAAHRRAEVPHAMFLAGGIEAMALLAVMARLGVRGVKAFTLALDGAAGGRRSASYTAAAALGAEPVEIAFDSGDFWRLLPAVAAAVDDPAADYAMVPFYKLAAAAGAEGCKVMLSAEGGDELFAGYGRYRSVMRPWWAGGRVPRARGVLDGLGVLRGEIAGWRDGIAAAEARNALPGRSRLQVAQAVDCADWLPNDLLLKLDRVLMAHGIEGRAPFLDPAIAAFAFCLPDELKIRHGLGKWLLRRWLADHLPAVEPLARRRGFTLPVGSWIAARAGQLGPLVAAAPAVRELCERAAVERLFAAAAQKRAGRAAWTLLFYALWHRRHIEGRELPPDTLAALAESG